jgi:hypothetical protein
MNDDELAARLGEALRPDATPPPAERVEALRTLAASEPSGHRIAELRRQAEATVPRRISIPAVAAVVALLLVLGVGSVVVATRGPTIPREPVTLLEVPPTVEADAELIAHTWGTELILEVSGLADGEVFTVAFMGGDGVAVSAGSFIGIGERPLHCELNAAILREDAVAFEITDRSGTVVIAADLP